MLHLNFTEIVATESVVCAGQLPDPCLYSSEISSN